MTTNRELADRLEQLRSALDAELRGLTLEEWGLIDEAVAALRADQAGEPVAYRYRYSNQGGWYVNSSPVASKALRERPGFYEQALYASSPNLLDELAQVKKERDRFKVALEFYRNNWQPNYIGDPEVAMRLFSEPTETLLRDEGKTAAQALDWGLRKVLAEAIRGAKE